jgi:glycosyltransferase involved in cell wall biosynthesis
MPRIVRILNRLNIGGPTYNAVYLSRYLDPTFETLLVAGTIDATEGDSSYIAHDLGLQPVLVPDMQRAIHPVRDRKAYLQIKEIIRDYKPDIVHTHAAKAGALGRLAASACKVPVVVHTFHGHVFHSYFSPLKTRVFIQIERFLARKSSAIVAISPQQKHDLGTVYRIAPPEKIHVVPNGFELSRFALDTANRRANFRSQYQLPSDTIVLGIVGRLVPVKHHGLFLEALARLKEITHVPFHAIIIGDGELRAQIENSATALGLIFDTPQDRKQNSSLTFASWVTQVEMVYPGLDVVVLTSKNEGTPVSLVEAQAAGLPVVATNVGGVSETMLHGKTGYVVPLDDVAALTTALARLIEDAGLRKQMGDSGRVFANQLFGYQRLCNDMQGLYEKLLAQVGR